MIFWAAFYIYQNLTESQIMQGIWTFLNICMLDGIGILDTELEDKPYWLL